MQVERLADESQLNELAANWNCLAGGIPFRTWAWLGSWWRHYGQLGELYVLSVRDSSGTLVGLAPWYLQPSTSQGRVLRFLGDGDVCTDYLSILTTTEHQSAVVAALQDWLLDAARGDRGPFDRWDLICLDGVVADDSRVELLVDGLSAAGCIAHRRTRFRCWRIELPGSWDDYLAMMSKSHRKQLRRVERRLLDSDRVVVRTVSDSEQLERAMPILVDLHQRRRQSLGEPGCFAAGEFDGFLHVAAPALLDLDMLQLHWVELDGSPVAAEFQVRGDGVTFAYQAGVDPDRMEIEPGRLVNIATIKRAIEDKQRAFDFLRGDEPYKAHFRAEPRECIEVRVAAPRTTAQLRHQLWAMGDAMKQWIKGPLDTTS